MAGLPDVIMVGTLVADPELKYTPNGNAVARFTVAANDRRFNAAAGEWVDAGAAFLRCSLWRQAAENVAESLRKGDRVIVTGRLKQHNFEADGIKRTAFELDVAEIGPSLRFATAKVNKLTRTGNTNTQPTQTEPELVAANSEPPF